MIRIKKLKCFDFRNYKEQVFEFNQNLVIFFGNNGRGKTNLLEAISILSTGKSWREARGVDLIRDDAVAAKIECTFDTNQYSTLIQPRSRSFWRNEKKISLTSHIGKIPTLLFCPEHLHLFIGNKSDRLRFFDRFLIQVFPLYRDLLLRANRAHKQKNACLKNHNNSAGLPSLLLPWNKILAETLPQIILIRKKFLQELATPMQRNFSEISQNTDPIEASFIIEKELHVSEEGILQFFEKEFARESIMKRNSLSSSSGDIHFLLRGKKLTQTASRGETRSALLSLLSAKKEYLQKEYNTSPILLLDDVFSELDDNRQKHLEKLCQNTQTFFTTTHAEHFKNFDEEIQHISV